MRKSLSVVFLTLANKIKLNKKSTHKYGKLAILLATVVSTANAGVLINEFDTNTSSSEYIELFNTTNADIDLGLGYSLVFYNGSNDTEYQTTALTGYLSANGYFVIAESGVTDIGGYEPDQNASWSSFQNGQDAVALVNNGTQVDAIIYGSSADTGLEALLGLTAGTLISNGSSGSSSRVTDGQGGSSYANDDWHITATRTPGSTNEVAPPSYTAYTIVEIQTPGTDGDASQHLGEYVETSGVITGATSYSFYMQDGTADYSGIYIYNNPGTAAVGDNVTVQGVVAESYGLTRIESVADVTINSMGNDVPTATLLTTGSLSEAHEGMLVKVSGECTAVSTNAGGDHWAFKVDDGSGDALVDDQIFSAAESAAIVGSSYDVVGPVNYYYSNFTVNPRDAADVVEAAATTYSVNFAIDMSSTGYPNDDYSSVVINYSPNWFGWGVTLLDEDLDGIYTGTLAGLADGTVAEFVVAVTGDADGWSGWGPQFGAPVMSECDVVQNGTNGNYGFTISGADVNVAYCPGTCEATCPTPPTGMVESFEGDFPPYGWTLYNNAGASNDISQATNYAYDGTYSMMFSSYYSAGGEYTQHAVTPLLDVGATGGNFSFWYLRNGYSTETFEVGISNTTDDLGSFTWGPVVSVTTNQVWAQHVEDLSAYAGEDIYVAIRYDDADNYYYRLHIDLVEGPPIWVDTDPVATLSPDVLDLGTVFISSSASGDITVSNNGGGTLTGTIASNNAKFTLSDFDGSIEPGESATITVTYTPTDVMDDMGYFILTHNGASSPDSVMVSGAGTSDILYQGFEGAWPPLGWTILSEASNNTISQSTTALSGSYSARFSSYSSSSTGYTQHLITPQVSLPADGKLFKFWYKGYSSFSAETFEVGISTTDSDPGSFVFGDVVTANNTSDWLESSTDLSGYAGQDVYIAIRYNNADNYYYYLFVDEVAVTDPPAVPIIDVSTNSITFPSTVINSTRSASVTIYNTGVGDLTGTITYPDGSAFSGPATFTTTTEEVISFSYGPGGSGIHTGSITIASNGGDDVSIWMSGNAGGSVATWDDDVDGDGEADWPAGWEVINNDGGSQEWDFLGGSHAHSGDGYTRVRYESSTIYNDDWLVSPKLDVVAGENETTFYAKTHNATGDFMSVMLSTTGGNTVADFDVTLLAATNIATDYTAFSYDLSAYAGTQVRIAIVYGGDYQWYLYVDDVATSAVYEEAGPVIYDYPLSLDFGTGLFGSSDTLLFDYFNTGGTDLLVTAVTFEENSGAFSLSSAETLPVTTEPGGIGSFDVVFSPAADGPNIDTMIVVHNAGDSLRIPVSGNGLNAIYYEDFGVFPNEWSEGWVFSDDGNHCPDDQGCSHSTGDYWRRTAFSSNVENGILLHWYNTATDADTAFAPGVVLEAVAGNHYELDLSEYNYYGFISMSAVCISTDGGATFAVLAEANQYEPGWSQTNHDLTAYDGQTINLAFVYQGTNENIWAVDNITIKSVADPIVPITIAWPPVFPATALGASSSAMLYYSNIGAGDLSGVITYPASMSGASEITGLAPGETDSTVVTYTPTAAGLENELIVIDGSASGATPLFISPEANAGELAFDFETSWCRWSQYSLMGFFYGTYPDTWLWWGGTNAGHSGNNYAGVYSYIDYWGGVDDYFVSPRLTVETGDVFSFWARGGNSDGTLRDSMTVYVSSEKPIMGFEYDADGMRMDTGFVNTDMFTQIYTGLPSWDKWDAHEYDLSNSAGDAWLISHSEMNELTGWQLKMDDIAHPNLYQNPNPVLSARHHFDFGLSPPDGADDSLTISNTGGADLVIESMSFIHGDDFYVNSESLVFPVTLEPGSSFSFEVVYDPDEYGPTQDTLKYYSNYMTGDEDAFGGGTDMTVFHGDSYNNPPGSFDIIAPEDGITFVVTETNMDDNIAFVWSTSYDPDGNPVTYLFSATDTEGEVHDTALTTVGWVPGPTIGELAESLLEDEISVMTYSWDVWATDSWDSTAASNGPRNMTIDVSGLLGVDGIGLPDVFALHNNYPNPFNPVTNITYDIPEVAQVTLDIYNLSGQKVRTLAQGQHEPGRYRIQWNATNDYGNPLSTGMYIYRIHAGDFVSVKKLILMK